MRTPTLTALAATTAALLALTGCGGGANSQTDKYTQTWSTSYGETDCSAFLGEMTSKQRWAAAADMLTSARNKMHGGTGLPADSDITRFESDMSTACTGQSQTLITETAVLLYQMDPSYAP